MGSALKAVGGEEDEDEEEEGEKFVSLVSRYDIGNRKMSPNYFRLNRPELSGRRKPTLKAGSPSPHGLDLRSLTIGLEFLLLHDDVG